VQSLLGHEAVTRPVLAGGRGPGEQVTLVPFGGKRRVHGFNNLVDGWAPLQGAYRPRETEAVRLAEEYGFMADGRPEPARRRLRPQGRKR